MNCRQLEKVMATLPMLFAYQEENGRYKITTPYLYPDGDYIDLYLVETPTGLYLTDLGETMGFLADYGISLKESPKRRKILDDVLLTHGVELFRGELRVALEENKVAWAVTRLSQAIIQIGDLIFSLRLSALTTFKEEVEEYWLEACIPYEVDYLVIGGSGESYTIDFYIPTPQRPWLVETLSSRSRSYANTLVSRIIRTWHDLHRIKDRYRYVSLIDDSTDVWKPEWFDQLAVFSEVIVWSGRERLPKILGLASTQNVKIL
jgi:hypothetical protein